MFLGKNYFEDPVDIMQNLEINIQTADTRCRMIRILPQQLRVRLVQIMSFQARQRVQSSDMRSWESAFLSAFCQSEAATFSMQLHMLKSFPEYFRMEYYFSSIFRQNTSIKGKEKEKNRPHSWTNEMVFHMSYRTSVRENLTVCSHKFP